MDERNKIEKVRQLGLALGTDKLELAQNAKLSADKLPPISSRRI